MESINQFDELINQNKENLNENHSIDLKSLNNFSDNTELVEVVAFPLSTAIRV